MKRSINKFVELKVGLLTVCYALLTGCSTYSNDFDCPMGEGMRCASLSIVNKAIDRGLLDSNEDERALAALASLPYKPEVLNSKSEITVWMAPYLDQTGKLHEMQSLKF